MLSKDPQSLIDELKSTHPNALRLAEVVSIAVRVEPELLRMARLNLVPEANAGDEAELWFSPLVQIRNTLGFVFYPEITLILRERISNNKKLLDEIWYKVFSKVHRSISRAIFIEEIITWRTLKDPNDPKVENLLYRTLSAIANDNDQNGVSHWFLRALPNFPESIHKLQIAKTLELGAYLRLGYVDPSLKIPKIAELESIPDYISPLVSTNLGRVKIGVSFVEGGIEFGTLSSLKAAKILELPATDPLLVDVSWREDSDQRRNKLIWLEQNKNKFLSVNASEIEIKTLLGDRYKLSKRVIENEETIVSTVPDPEKVFTKREDNYDLLTKPLLNSQSESPATIAATLVGALGDGKSALINSVVNMAPKPEDVFISRETEYNQLIEALSSSQIETKAVTVIALVGAGGYGKSTLAKAVCHDPKIMEKFSDGVLWVTLGENPSNLIGYIQDFIYHLSRERRVFGTLNSAIAFLSDLINEKQLLIVIDDVWNSEHLEPFLHGGPHCTRLVTTRNGYTLPPKILRIFVGSMLEEEAIGVLKYGIPLENEIFFRKLAERLGCWPLLLKIVNSMLQYRINELKESIYQALEFINEGLNEEGLTAFDKKNPESRSQAVDATFAVSLKALSDDERAFYLELAIFPEDIDISLKVLEKLWSKTGNFSHSQVKRFCTKLYSMSLLQKYDLKNDFVSLHDVVREYLMSRQKEKLPLLHSIFLEAYEVETWAELPEEEIYLWKNISYHLVGAGKKAELRRLLLDFNWIQSKLNATDVHSLINDYNFFQKDYSIEMVKGAIQLSSNILSKDKRLLGEQLLGRLELFSDTEIKSLLSQIREHGSGIRIVPLIGNLTSPGGTLLRTLEGHSSSVNAVCITPDGNYAVSGSSDKTLKFWDLKIGKEVCTLIGHSSKINAVSITPDGKYAVSASNDGTLKVWDLKTGKEVCTLIGHSSKINAVSITPDGKYVISASSDRTLKVWNINTGEEIRTLTGHSDSVEAVSITPDGKYAVSGSDDRTLKVWDIKTGSEVRTLAPSSKISFSVTHIERFRIKAVSITPDGKYVVSSLGDIVLGVWDLKTGRTVRSLWSDKSDSKWVNSVSITPNGKYAVSASNDRIPIVWDLNTGMEVRALEGHSGYVNSVSITPDGKYVVSASRDRTLKVWDLKAENKVSTLIGHSNRINSVFVPPNGKYAVSASSDKTLKFWDLKTGKKICGLNNDNSILAVCVTPYGKYAVLALSNNTLKVWNLKTGKMRKGKRVRTLTGHLGSVNSVSITPDGNYAVSASNDRTLKIWDLNTWKEVLTLEGHFRRVNSVSVTPDGKYAVSGSSDKTLKIWDLKTGEEILTLKGHSDSVNAVSITSDGNYVISGSSDSLLKVWDLKMEKEISAFAGDSPILSVVFSSDDTIIVAGEQSGRLHFLQLER